MEWIEALRQAIGFMEAHLLEDVTQEDVARNANLSCMYFARGFKIVTGYSPAEYIRCRRLYLAALDVLARGDKVIDIAYRYGYETPESFSKAFYRFHGATPTQLRAQPHKLHAFLPLRIHITVAGGETMDCRVERMEAFSVIGLKREFESRDAYAALPAFWQEFWAWHRARYRQAVEDTGHFWQYGVCMDGEGRAEDFAYMIAGVYGGGPVPQGLTVERIPAQLWAKFRCVGPMPGAMQAVNERIFKEWLPGNAAYELAGYTNVEWYGPGDNSGADYSCEIWIPIGRRAPGREA